MAVTDLPSADQEGALFAVLRRAERLREVTAAIPGPVAALGETLSAPVAVDVGIRLPTRAKIPVRSVPRPTADYGRAVL